MTYKTTCLMCALAGAVAAIVVTAPAASASNPYSCNTAGAGTVCQSPGNVQLNDAAPPTRFYPYGGEGFLLSGGGAGGSVSRFGGGGSHGGHR